VLSRLFRRLFLQGLAVVHAAGELAFFNDLSGLRSPAAFNAYLAPGVLLLSLAQRSSTSFRGDIIRVGINYEFGAAPLVANHRRQLLEQLKTPALSGSTACLVCIITRQ
jgi:hypothetical protein